MPDLMSRRQILAGISVAPSLLSAPRPNIILCMGDDHGWWETGYNRHPYVRTPVLDEMASKGVCFDRMYSAAPVCSPTRGSVMTGRHPNRYGTFSHNWSIRPQEITIAQILKKAGYACGHFGKWHLGPVKAGSPTNPGAMGFDEWLSHDNFFEIDPPLSHNGAPPKQFKGESSEVVVGEAARFIGAAKRKHKPSFTVVWFGSPHSPYRATAEDLKLYNKVPFEALQARYAEITAMDRAMGQLRSYLRREDLHQNTLVWYCGDNGVVSEARLDMPLRGFKGHLYDGGLRVPGVLEWPEGVPRPVATDVNVVTSDILPTICDLLGLPGPGRPLDGISVRAALEGGMKARPAPICFWQYDAQRERREGQPYIDPELQQGDWRTFFNIRHPKARTSEFGGQAAILGNRYKLVALRKDAPELYDVLTDPAETKDLAQPKPDLVKEMDQQLRSWQRSVEISLTGADY